MNCPICKVGEVESEYCDPEGLAELSCSNEKCPTTNYGIYCYIDDFIGWQDADAFYEEWETEEIANNKFN